MFNKNLLSTAIALSAALSAAGASAQMATPAGDNELLDEIVVVGIRASLTQGLDYKRNEMQIVDAIVSEDIGKFPDNNVVEALQRVTGVQVSQRGGGEASAVNIRGLGDITTTINGRTMYTAAGRSVELADIPSSLLSNVIVYKTRSAAETEGGIAGQIDVRTHRPFDFDGGRVNIAARGIYSSNSEETDPNVSALFSTRWNTPSGEFGALLNLSYAETHYRDESIWNSPVGPYNINTGMGLDYGASDDLSRGQALPTAPGSTVDINGNDVEYMLQRELIGGAFYSGVRERPAANLSLQFAPDDRSEYTFEAFYNGYRNEIANSSLFSFTNHFDTYQPREFFPDSNVVKETFVNNPYVFTSGVAEDSKTDSYLFSLGGDWEISDRLNVQSELVYQASEFERRGQIQDMASIRYRLEADFNRNSGIPALAFPDNPSTDVDEGDLTLPQSWNLTNYFDQYGRDRGDSITWSADGEYLLEGIFWDKFEFGVRYDRRTAEVAAAERSASCENVFSCASASAVAEHEGLYRNTPLQFFEGETDFPRQWITADADYLLNNPDQSRERYGFAAGLPEFDPLRQFDAEENTLAAYFQAEYVTRLAGRELDGQIGARLVESETGLNYSSLQNDGSWGPASTTVTDTRVLPNFLVRYRLTDDLITRLSYSETISRPEFSALNPAMAFLPGDLAVSGNADLEPVESKNVDLTLEYYLSESSSVYGTAFQRDIDGFVFDVSRLIEVEGRGAGLDGNYLLTQPDNSGKGELRGLEVGAQWFPEQVPDWLHGIGVQASYTLIDGDTQDPVFEQDEDGTDVLVGFETNPLVGVSDNSYNLVVAYEKGPFTGRVSYVYRDGYLAGYNYCCAMPNELHTRSERWADLQLSYELTDAMVVTFDVTNLTNETYQDYYGNPELFSASSNRYSQTFALGMRYEWR